jgi:hypothetical protein
MALTVSTIKATGVQQAGSGGAASVYSSTAYFMTRLTANSNPNDASTFSLRTVFNTVPLINQGGFSSDGNYINVPEAGLYIVSANVAFNNASARDVPGFRFGVSLTGATNAYSGQVENSLSSYIRVASNHNEASTELVTAYQLNVGSGIRMEFRRFGNTGTNTTIIPSYSYITVWRLGA